MSTQLAPAEAPTARALTPAAGMAPCPAPTDGITPSGAVAALPALSPAADAQVQATLAAAHAALDAEIAEVRRQLKTWGGDQPASVTSHSVDGRTGDTFLYRVSLTRPVKAPDFTPVDVQVGTSRYSGIVDEVWEGGRVHVLALTERIPRDDLEGAVVSWDPTGLLMAIKHHLDALGDGAPGSRELIAAMLGVTVSPTRDTPLEHPSMARRGLNAAQIASAQRLVPSPVAVLHGPPGTGKTKALGSTVALQAETLGRRVLVLAPTNVALDTALASIVESVSPATQAAMLRVGKHVREYKHLKLTTKDRPRASAAESVDAKRAKKAREAQAAKLLKQAEALHAACDPATTRRSFAERFGPSRMRGGEEASPLQRAAGLLAHVSPALEPHAQALRDAIEALETEMADAEKTAAANSQDEAKVVGMTLAALMMKDPSEIKAFDAVVVDEASMALVPQLLAAARFARQSFHCYGDPQQLGPIVAHDGPTARWLKQTLWHHLQLADPALDDPRRPFLTMQYRMDPPICTVVSDAFYAGRLVTAPSVLLRKPSPLPLPALLILDTWQTDALSMSKGSSRVNARHVEFVTTLLDGMERMGARLEDAFYPSGLGIVTPFNVQQYAYKDKLDEVRPGMLSGRQHWVRTIHRAQGGETAMLLFDTVDSGAGRGGWFTSDANTELPCLVNVALSRAQRHLILLANTRTLSPKFGGKSGLLTRILRIAAKTGCYVTLPPEGITPQNAPEILRQMHAGSAVPHAARSA